MGIWGEYFSICFFGNDDENTIKWSYVRSSHHAYLQNNRVIVGSRCASNLYCFCCYVAICLEQDNYVCTRGIVNSDIVSSRLDACFP